MLSICKCEHRANAEEDSNNDYTNIWSNVILRRAQLQLGIWCLLVCLCAWSERWCLVFSSVVAWSSCCSVVSKPNSWVLLIVCVCKRMTHDGKHRLHVRLKLIYFIWLDGKSLDIVHTTHANVTRRSSCSTLIQCVHYPSN